ncbi:CDK5 regulatory subunit-associated protein 2, partial [Dissostichus eleginoides]
QHFHAPVIPVLTSLSSLNVETRCLKNNLDGRRQLSAAKPLTREGAPPVDM